MKKSCLLEPNEVFRFRKERENEFTWTIPLDLPYFEGHFPGNPVLPAIAILDASLEVIRLSGSRETPFVKKIHSAKFTDLMRPGDEVFLKYHAHEIRHMVRWQKRNPDQNLIQTAEIIFEI